MKRVIRLGKQSAVLATCVALVLLAPACEDGDDGGGGSGGGASVADYAGTLTGTWSGSGYSGQFSVVVTPNGVVTGTFWGDDAGTVTGTVNAQGVLSASAAGTAGLGTWSGQLTSRNGALAGGHGTWSYPDGSSGTWQGP